MLTQKDYLRRRMRYMVGLIAVICFLLTAYICCFMDSRFAGDYSFLNAIEAFFISGNAIFFFPILMVIGICIWLYYERKRWTKDQYSDVMGRDFSHSRERMPYGDAHFEMPYEFKEMAQVRRIEDCKGKVIGQLSKDGTRCIDFNPYDGRSNMHMLAIGTSGSGKTFAFVKPFIYQARKERHSIVITDPDGGLYRDMAGYLRDNGYIVRKLDLKDLMKSDGWHCMATLRGANMSTNVKIFAQTVISNISTENNIYSSASNSLLCALLLRVLLGHEYPEDQKNIKSVYQLLQNPAGYSFLETKFDKNLLQEDELPCLAPYLAYKQASENLAANIATHLANGLQLLQDEALCDVLSTDDIDLTLPGRTPCAYFCQFPDLHQTYKFIISLFFSMFFIALSDYADLHTREGKLQVQVDFLLDEFYSIGIIPDWPAKMSVVRKRGINCVMIIQDIPQLQERYEKTWQTIVENCSAIVTLSINESDKTAPWLSKRIGETSIEVNSTSESEIIGKSRKPWVNKKSVGVGKRSLLAPDEICRICRDNNLILFAGHNPIYAMKTPHTLFPDSKKLYKISPDDVIDFSDRAGRARFRECEEAYRKQFWETHDINLDLRYSDLSDAQDLEEQSDPLPIFLEIIIEDIRKLIDIMIFKKSKSNTESVEDSTGQNIDLRLAAESAEKGAFLKFKEEFDLQYIDEEDVEKIGFPEYVDTNTIAVDVETGEIIAPEAEEMPVFARGTQSEPNLTVSTDLLLKPIAVPEPREKTGKKTKPKPRKTENGNFEIKAPTEIDSKFSETFCAPPPKKRQLSDD